jgi:3-dehydroquinate synthase
MKTIRVSLGDQSYDIQIGSGVLFKAGSILRKLNVSKRGIVISSSRILSLHGEKLINSLHRANLSVEVVTIADGERAKSLSTVEAIYKQLVAFRADRKTTLIAFGGGVVGDIVGFTAATFLRGIPYIQVPTTLLAQIDSSVGGKTGVNLSEGKNLVGAFHQPRAVVIDPLVLLTLPRREFNSGVYEAIKYGVIQNPALFHLVDQKHTRFPERERTRLEEMIMECVRIKADIVSRDERESDLRMILNFGHTIGHALESATRYRKLTHGEAIGHGMIMATQLATKLNKIEAREGLQIQEAIARISPLPSIHSLKWDQIFRHMLSDKKVVERRLQFVLPLRIGQAEIHRDTPGEVVKQTIRAYLQSQQKD